MSQAVQTYRVPIRIERDRRREELTWTLTWRIKDVDVNMNRRDDGVFKTNVKSSADDVKNWRRERRRAEESTSKKKMWKIEDVNVNI